VGAAITYPLCGFLINWFDWPSVYYATGVVGITWFIAWWLLVYDSPAQHPHISEKERTYILSKLGKTVTERNVSVRMELFLCIFCSLHLLG
jgi:ACS family sodium-dependent inorganic phosphate cotransporter